MQKMKKIKVCADPFPPYQYIDRDGEMKGRDYELVVNRLRKAGYEPEVWIAPWNQIYSQFEKGEQDALFQAQDSPERLKKFYLSRLLRYAVTEVVTVKKELQTISEYKELEKYKVGVIDDFANGPEIDGLSADCKVGYADAEKLLKGIYSGEVDMGVADQGVKEYLAQESPVLYSIPRLTYKRPLYVMFRDKKHRDDFDAAE